MFVFGVGGRPENPKKTLGHWPGEKKKQMQPAYGTGPERTHAALVRGERSYHALCHLCSRSPVPELSFLPAPHRGLRGAGRKESSGTGLLLLWMTTDQKSILIALQYN